MSCSERMLSNFQKPVPTTTDRHRIRSDEETAVGVTIPLEQIGDLDAGDLVAIAIGRPDVEQRQIVPLAQLGQDQRRHVPAGADHHNLALAHVCSLSRRNGSFSLDSSAPPGTSKTPATHSMRRGRILGCPTNATGSNSGAGSGSGGADV